MRTPLEQLKEFNTTFNAKRGINPDNIALRLRMLSEEYTEVLKAFSSETHEQQLKELIDLAVIIVGTCESFGWDFDEAFRRVVASNMTKLDKDGKVIYREDGKILKSDRYEPPVLSDLVKNSSETQDK
jgi:predicted HAD superfamily Cof-like phosphohydrolase